MERRMMLGGGVDAGLYLTFTSEGTSTLGLSVTHGWRGLYSDTDPPVAVTDPSLQYSYDAVTFSDWDYSALTFTRDRPLYIRGINPYGVSCRIVIGDEYFWMYSSFVIGGDPVECSGNVMSLIDWRRALNALPGTVRYVDGIEIDPYGCFYMLFKDCTLLKKAPDVPVRTASVMLCDSMFYGCSSLAEAPVLTAVNLSHACYRNMFYGCTGLISAPELPATTLAPYCYDSMFASCAGLTEAPALPAAGLSEGCYEYMFQSTAITRAPELPAEYPAAKSYACMFRYCGSLSYVKAMLLSLTDSSQSPVMESWLDGVSSSGTFVKSGSAAWGNDEAGIPAGWTVETA